MPPFPRFCPTWLGWRVCKFRCKFPCNGAHEASEQALNYPIDMMFSRMKPGLKPIFPRISLRSSGNTAVFRPPDSAVSVCREPIYLGV